MLCYAGTSADRAQQTLDVMLAEIDRLGREGIEPEELETMRAGLKSSLIMAQESSMSRSGALASDWYFLGRVRPLEEISAELDALTPRSVSDYAAGFVHMRRPDDPHAGSHGAAASRGIRSVTDMRVESGQTEFSPARIWRSRSPAATLALDFDPGILSLTGQD